ncbi:MAG TPA: hypothetical protein VEQ59_08830 [Polyangiaceae bacterium]|nr:hypothetical protein [Polyangiaceae bacterium]
MRRCFSSCSFLGPCGIALALAPLPACSSGSGAETSVGGQSGAAAYGGQSTAGGGNGTTGPGAGASFAGAAPGGSPGGGATSVGGAAGESAAAGGAGGSNGGVGAPSGGGGGVTSGGAAGAGGAPSGECTRALLDGLLDQFFSALSAGDPSSLPLAPTVKFTENAQSSTIGATEFWKNAGDTKYSQRALDTQACSAAAQAVVPEGSTDRPVAVRIKVVGAQLTEIETIVVRPGDYTASFAVDSNPAAIISIAPDIGWHDDVPAAQRATRQQLTSWVDKYFRAFPSGVCNVTSACRRLENGGGNFSCGAGASCSASTPTTGGTFEPRVVVVDEQRGIAAGFTIFDYQTTGHLDMHMIKMSGGQVHAVHAILRDTAGKSGWE